MVPMELLNVFSGRNCESKGNAAITTQSAQSNWAQIGFEECLITLVMMLEADGDLFTYLLLKFDAF